MFKFIKAITPKFSQHNAKNDGVFKVLFHNLNLELKTLKLATCCLIFVAKKWHFLASEKTPAFWIYEIDPRNISCKFLL